MEFVNEEVKIIQCKVSFLTLGIVILDCCQKLGKSLKTCLEKWCS